MMLLVALSELHPLSRNEIAKLPAKPGVYVLFQVQIPVHADAAKNLRRSLLAAKAKFAGATHFAVEVIEKDSLGVVQRLGHLRKELARVRTAGFIGSDSRHS
jgi:hypothetical protein